MLVGVVLGSILGQEWPLLIGDSSGGRTGAEVVTPSEHPGTPQFEITTEFPVPVHSIPSFARRADQCPSRDRASQNPLSYRGILSRYVGRAR